MKYSPRTAPGEPPAKQCWPMRTRGWCKGCQSTAEVEQRVLYRHWGHVRHEQAVCMECGHIVWEWRYTPTAWKPYVYPPKPEPP